MDNETMDNAYYSDGLYRPHSMFGKIMSYIGVAIIVLVLGLLFFRIYISKDPKAALTHLWTPESVAAYNEAGDSFKIYKQEIHSYNLPTGKDEKGNMTYERITYNDITSDGTFKISGLTYVPATKELQITVRYNRLALESLQAIYHLSELPAGEPFVFSLQGVGESGNEFSTDYTYKAYSRFTYEYRRLVFKNVDLQNSEIVNLYAYYASGNADLESPLVFGNDKNPVPIVLPIFDIYLGFEEYSLKDALPAEPSELKNPPYVYFGENN